MAESICERELVFGLLLATLTNVICLYGYL
jgi:hypothetical protein